MWHDVFVHYGRKICVDLKDSWKLCGDIDAIINDVVFELKTVSRRTVEPSKYPSWLNQSAIYSFLTNKPTILLFISTKLYCSEEENIHSYNVIPFQPDKIIPRALEYLDYLMKEEEPPGEKSYDCRFCPLKDTCSPERELEINAMYVKDEDDYKIVIDKARELIIPKDMPYFCEYYVATLNQLKKDPVRFNRCLALTTNNSFYFPKILMVQRIAQILENIDVRGKYGEYYLYTTLLNSYDMPDEPYDINVNVAMYNAEKHKCDKVAIVLINRRNQIKEWVMPRKPWERWQQRECKICSLRHVCEYFKEQP